VLKVFALLVLGLLITSSFSGSHSAKAATNETLVIGAVIGTPTTFALDGFSTYIGNQQADIPYLPFGVVSQDGQITAGISKPPVAVPGSNSTQWVFNLVSPDLKWSDGVPINSSDLAYSIGIYLTTGPYANLTTTDYNGAITGVASNVTILNSTAIQVQTITNPGFPYKVFPYPVYPWHYFKQFQGNDALETTPILGGPGDSAYLPVNYTAGSSVMNLVANPYSPSWDGRTPGINNITIDFFASDTSLVNALAAGTVDLATITPSDVGALNTTSSLTIVQVPNGGMTFINIRNVGYPWNSTDFRQALLYLIDKGQINSEVYGNQSVIENAAVIPSSSPWLPSDAQTYNYNPTEAKQLLQEAGLHQNAQGGWLLANGTALPAIVFQAADSDSAYVRTAQLITSDWQSAGLSVTLQEEPISAVNTAIYSTRTFDVAYADGGFLPVPWRYAYNAINFPSGTGGAWVNSTYAQLKTEADNAPNTAAQDQLLQQLVYTLAQNAVVDGVVSDISYVAYNNQRFTNVTSAIQAAAASDFFIYPPFAESVLTSVTPVSATSTTSTSTTAASSSTSSSAVTSTSTTSSSTTSGSTTELLAAIVVVVVVIALGGFVFSRRARGKQNPA